MTFMSVTFMNASVPSNSDQILCRWKATSAGEVVKDLALWLIKDLSQLQTKKDLYGLSGSITSHLKEWSYTRSTLVTQLSEISIIPKFSSRQSLGHLERLKKKRHFIKVVCNKVVGMRMMRLYEYLMLQGITCYFLCWAWIHVVEFAEVAHA